jgi:hypothetical protein
MKFGSPDQSQAGNDARASWDASDPLWRLLGESPRPEPDGWFAARTLARCRNEAANETGDTVMSMRTKLVKIWRWALAGGLAASMAVVLVMSNAPTQPAPDQQSVQEAFEIVASMDTDSDSSSSSWQDSSR